MTTLFISSLLVLFISSSSSGLDSIIHSTSPLDHGFAHLFSITHRYALLFTLPGLFATAHGFLYAGSVQISSMGQSKLFPELLGQTIRRYRPPTSPIPPPSASPPAAPSGQTGRSRVDSWREEVRGFWNEMKSVSGSSLSSRSRSQTQDPRQATSSFSSSHLERNPVAVNMMTAPLNETHEGEEEEDPPEREGLDQRKLKEEGGRGSDGPSSPHVHFISERDSFPLPPLPPQSLSRTSELTTGGVRGRSTGGGRREGSESEAATATGEEEGMSKSTIPFTALLFTSFLCYCLCLLSTLLPYLSQIIFPLSTCCGYLMYLSILLSYIIFKLRYPSCKRYFLNPGGIFSAIVSFVIFSVCVFSLLVFRPAVDVYRYLSRDDTEHERSLITIGVPGGLGVCLIVVTIYFHQIAKGRMHYSEDEQKEMFTLLLIHRECSLSASLSLPLPLCFSADYSSAFLLSASRQVGGHSFKVFVEQPSLRVLNSRLDQLNSSPLISLMAQRLFDRPQLTQSLPLPLTYLLVSHLPSHERDLTPPHLPHSLPRILFKKLVTMRKWKMKRRERSSHV
jgi:hypothetical protein